MGIAGAGVATTCARVFMLLIFFWLVHVSGRREQRGYGVGLPGWLRAAPATAAGLRRIGLPAGGYWKEVLNSDAEIYAGSGQGNSGGLEAEPLPSHGRPYSLMLTIPPLGCVIFKRT